MFLHYLSNCSMKQYKRLVEKSVNKRIRTIIQQDRNVGNCAENAIFAHWNKYEIYTDNWQEIQKFEQKKTTDK